MACSVSHVLAQDAFINLDLRISNIATAQTRSCSKQTDEIPYRKIRAIYEHYRNQTNLGREINLDWSLVNYQMSREFFHEKIPGLSGTVPGYHLFDVVWFTPRISIEYMDKAARVWQPTYALTSGFDMKVSSQAIIKGYGNVPVYTTPGVQLLPANTEQTVDGLTETLIKEVHAANYHVRVFLTPVIKSFYARIDEPGLANQKIELFGILRLDSSGLRTETPTYLYPFDSYAFKFSIKCRYPTLTRASLTDAEDLDVVGTRQKAGRIGGGERTSVEFGLRRKDIARSIILPIVAVLVSIVTQTFERRWKRVAFLCINAIILLVTLWASTPLHIPRVNLFSIIIVLVFLAIVVLIEVTKSTNAISPGDTIPQRRGDSTTHGEIHKKGQKKVK